MYDLSEIAMGFYAPNTRRVTGLGSVTIGTTGATTTDIWTGGGQFPFMSAATSLEIVSASANDTAAGAGARVVNVVGIDANFDEVTLSIVMNGTSAVPIPTPLRHINLITIPNGGTGSGRTNAGTITVRDGGGGTTRMIMPAGASVSQSSAYLVPNAHTLLIYSIELEINSSAGGGGSSKGADATFYFAGSGANDPIRLPRKMSCTDITPFQLSAQVPIPVQEKSYFMLRCTYTSAALSLSGSWEGVLQRRSKIYP